MASSSVPPLGPDPNLGPVVIALNCVVFALSTVVVLLRLFTRICLTRNLGWDDATMALTQVWRATQAYTF